MIVPVSLIARYHLPESNQRINPRVVKPKMSKFPLKRLTHRRWPQPSKAFRDTIILRGCQCLADARPPVSETAEDYLYRGWIQG
ncbi:MAG: hypothetical protein HYS70_02655 [Nitrospinae bacterium]|nr:hypothetical protein [Nitrospinota bacterium]